MNVATGMVRPAVSVPVRSQRGRERCAFARRWRRGALAGAALLVLGAGSVLGQTSRPPRSQAYRWKNVQIVGGGFVSGIVFHPTAPGVRYARTDIGGAYRWSEPTHRWEPLLDWVSYEDRNLMGVESIAVDPSDPNRVYLAVGTYTAPGAPNGAVLRSADRGATFKRTGVPFKLGGNENGRGNGERMAVDPNDGRIIYLGTRHAGLWRSTDRGATWTRMTAFPDVGEPEGATGAGIVFVVFDPRGSAGHPSSTIYVGASLMGRDNLFRSIDGGASWRPVPGQPTGYRPNHAVLASNGVLYLSYGTEPGPWPMTKGAVWKLDTRTDAWTDVTPDRPDGQNRRFGYVSVAVDARDPQRLIASSFQRPEGEEIFRSTDGGATWKPIFAGGGKLDSSLAPFVAFTGIHWLFDIEIDPANPDHALFTTGYGGYETFDLSDADRGQPTRWTVMTTGIEETVPLDLVSPNAGAHLLSGVGDYGGFVHRDLDRPQPEGNYDNPRFGNTNSIAVAEHAPDLIVRVGRPPWGHTGPAIGYSLDGGRSWQPARAPTPESMLGQVAVSADGASWVWTPEGRGTFVTRDRGATWTPVPGLAAEPRIIADREDPRRFYGLDLSGGKLFVSTDGGSTFEARPLDLPPGTPPPGDPASRGDRRGGQDRLYATPGREGDLWLAAFDGLYHSTNRGGSFQRLPDVRELHAFGFGKAAPGRHYPALFLVGVVDGVRGIFRSDDAARHWVRINDDRHRWGLVLLITGDPRVYGRVYVGTHGRGALYGDPVRPGP